MTYINEVGSIMNELGFQYSLFFFKTDNSWWDPAYIIRNL